MAEVKDVTIRINVEDKSIKNADNLFDKMNKKITEQEGLLGKLQAKEKALLDLRNKSNDPKAIQRFNSEIEKTQSKMNSLTSTAKKQESAMSKLNKSIVRIGVAMAGAFAIKQIVGNAVKTIVEFDKAMASLSAITGVTGKNLEGLKKKVFEVAKETGKGATEIAAAFELVGSKAPKLLENADALAAVTKEAITLSKATGEDLSQSAGALTGVMNQFNLSASESSRIINALAAGSQKGAAPVGQIADAIDKFGTVANAANISVEESIGLVETLAEKNITGAQAGTQLRNIILKLQAANIGYTDGVFNLNDALQEVNDKNLSATEATKLFGLESITAGNILVNNIGTIDKYTEAVTGSNIANEQAAINSDTLAVKTEELGNQWDNFIISLDDSTSVIGGVSRALIDFFGDALTGLENLDLIWKGTFGDMADFTDEELSRTLKGGWVTEFGVNIDKITSEFDKIPFDQMTKNVDKVKEGWVELLGDDRQEAILLFNQYIKEREEAEKALKKSTNDVTDATEEDTTATDTNSESKKKQLTLLEKQIKLQKEFKDELEGARGLQDDPLAEEKEIEETDDELFAFADKKQKEIDILKEAKEKEREIEKENQDLLFEEELLRNERDLEKEEERKALEQEEHELKLQRNLEIASGAADLAGVLSGLAKQGSVEAKALASIQVVINGAVAITKALAQLGPIAGGFAVAGIVASTSAQLAKINSVKTLKDGEILINGPGTETSDSIPAMLSKNESVINANSSKKHTAALKAINDDRFNDYLNKEIIKKLYLNKPKEIAVAQQKSESIEFPKGFRINNPSAISQPLVEALEEYNFLNQGQGWV